MITTPIGFVLGAGASAPYGFPTAFELKRRICEAFSSDESEGTKFFEEKCELDPKPFISFQEAFGRSGQPSIDAFLEYRDDFLLIGKLAIAYCLMPLEDERLLFSRNTNHGGDWYEHIFNRLKGPFDSLDKNQIFFVTFNYDRSLEHYLLTVIRNTYGTSAQQSADLVSRIPIVHVYGQLSILPYPESRAHSYRPERLPRTAIHGAADGIKVIGEQGAEANLAKAKELLTLAEHICFLGFGYHQVNIARLGSPEFFRSKVNFGTSKGLVGMELDNVKELIPGITLHSIDNLEFLRSQSLPR